MIVYNIGLTKYLEFLVRAGLHILFIYFEGADPFVRIIQPEEIWLYKYPSSPNIITASALWGIVYGVPVVVLTVLFIFQKMDKKDVVNFIQGFTLATGLNGLLTALIKNMVGRPRPDFLARCYSDGQNIQSFGTLKCTGNPNLLREGRKSFPSGHSSFAFVSMVFLSMFLLEKLKLWKLSCFTGCKVLVCGAPLLLATAVAISRTCDYHHHFEDVIAGGLLGIVLAYICFNLYIPSNNQNEDDSDDKRNKENELFSKRYRIKPIKDE